jgi:hypothetical protein
VKTRAAVTQTLLIQSHVYAAANACVRSGIGLEAPKLSAERATEGGFRLISDVGSDVRNAPRCLLERAAYLCVMTLAAWVVYCRLGLAFLRTAWFNLDWVWAGALTITGVAVLFR